MKAADVKFGIEIECNIPSEYSDSFPQGGYHNGIQSPVLPAGWNTQSDASVQTSGSGMIACEIVSPKLWGETGLIQVVEVLDLLDSINARVNRSCGLHVHMSTEGLTPEQTSRVIKVFKHFEKAFYALNGSMAASRYSGNHYCLPSPQWNRTRYQSLNQTHLNETHPHLEVRVWTGSLKPEMVIAAIYMAVSLISRCSDDTPIKTSHLDQNKPVMIMADYIRQFVKGDNMIVNELDPKDLFLEMIAEARIAVLP